MTLKRSWLFAVIPLLSTPFCLTQTSVPQPTLKQVFLDLHSSDQVTVDAAKDSIVAAFSRELPRIEKEEALICGALKDPDPYVRLQATALLSTIVVAAPEHMDLVTSCVPNLLVTATDSVDRVRNNALEVLVTKSTGPSSDMRGLLLQAMASQNMRTSQLGAVGLLRLGDETTVLNALKTTTDPKQQLNLLYAIGGAQRKSDALFNAVQPFAYSSQGDMQLASIDALLATSTSSAQSVRVLGSVSSARGTTADAKAHSDSAIEGLQGQP